MSDIFWIEKQIETLIAQRKITQQQGKSLLLKANQNDKLIISLFKTLEWSLNEKEFIQKVYEVQASEEKLSSNFSTETSLKHFRSRPPSIIVPYHRSLKYFSEDFGCEKNPAAFGYEKISETSLEHLAKRKKKEALKRFRCSHELRFESDEEEDKIFEEISKGSSLNSLELEITVSRKNSEKKLKVLKSLTNVKGDYQFYDEDNKKSDEKIMEKKMSIDEILEKYQNGIDNEMDGFIKEDEEQHIETNEDDFLIDDNCDTNELDKPIPVIDRKLI